jgi:hypothetical protein
LSGYATYRAKASISERKTSGKDVPVVGWLIPAASKGAPCHDAGEYPAVIFQLTIDDDVVDASPFELPGDDAFAVGVGAGGAVVASSAAEETDVQGLACPFVHSKKKR